MPVTEKKVPGLGSEASDKRNYREEKRRFVLSL